MDILQANQQLMELRERNRREKVAKGLLSPQREQPSSPASADELTHPCPYCGAPIPPFEFSSFSGGPPHYRHREWCDCEAAVQVQAEQAEKAKQEELASQLSELLHSAKIGVGRYAGMKFSNWDAKRHSKAKKHLQDVMSYCNEVKETGANLCFLYGQYGRGKTHLAIAALRHITRLHLEDTITWRPYFVEWLEHCSTVQQSWDDHSGGPTEGQLWGKMKNATILVIDDVDKGRPSEWAMGKLLEVAQHRYVREKPTIITANHSLQQLQEAWLKSDKDYVRDAGGAIASRWMGQLWGQIEVTGPDQRDV